MLKENWLKKMNGICLMNQVRSRVLRYTSQIAEEASFFFQLSCSEHDFMINNLVRLNLLEASQEHTSAMLVKLQLFIPQFNQFHPEYYYHIASLDGYFCIYV